MKIHLTLLALLSANSAFAADFNPETIDDKIEIGYGLSIGDVDGDMKPDILIADKREIRWYSNPTWESHVIAKNLTLRDNVCIATTAGSGGLQIAVGAQWNPGENRDREKSGAVFYLSRPEDPTGAWTPVKLPHDPTTHRMHWLDAETLAVLPLHGIGGSSVRLGLYKKPSNPSDPTAWKVSYVDTGLTKAHNFDLIGNSALVAGAEGSYAYPSGERTADPKGFGEIRRHGNILAGISPMHGNEVRVQRDGKWTTLDDSLNQGHALAIGDLLGTGMPQVVAAWRNPDKTGKVGIRIYSQPQDGGQWTTQQIDENTMACEDLKLADLDSDGDLDVIAAGRASKNLIIYWNTP